MQKTAKFARLVVGSLGILSASWSALLLRSELPSKNPDLLVAVISGCGFGLASSVFLILTTSCPRWTNRFVSGQSEVLPAEGGKGVPVDQPQFRVPVAVIPLSLILIASFMAALQLPTLAWRFMSGIDPTAGIILTSVGLSGVLAFRESSRLIRKALSSSKS